MNDEQSAQPTEAELQAALEEQMRNIRVEDVVVQTTVTLVNLGARRLGLAAAPGTDPGAERDLAQAQIAIEAVRALLPLCPQEVEQQIAPALSQLQMAYVQEAQGGAAAAAEGGQPGAQAPAADSATGQTTDDEAERAKARAKIWTPGGN